MLQVILNGLIIGGLYALMTIGFNLIYSSVRFHNLAYGALALFGGYLTRFIQTEIGLHFIVSMFVSAVLIALIGVLMWMFVYKPMRKIGSSDSVMLVASFGLLIIIQNLISLIFSPNAKIISLTDGKIVEAFEFFGLKITMNQLVILLVTIVIVVIFDLILTRTKLGTAIRAVGQNRDLASVSGIPSDRILLYSFFIGTVLSVIGASLSALEVGLRPTLALVLILKIIIAAIIGGIGSIRGALLGGLILGLAENIGVFMFGGRWQDTIAFVLLVSFLIFKPDGLFSSKATRSI